MKLSRSATALVTLGLLAGISFAAEEAAPANPDPKAVDAGAFTVEPYHTRVQFGVSHVGFSTFYGDFSGVSGTLELDPKNIATSKVNISIPAASVLTTVAQLNDELKGNNWLDAKQFPEITFVSTKVKKTGARTAEITGNLSLHGVTKPVTLEATFNAAGVNPLDQSYTAGFDATASLRRSDFGVKTYVPMIGDEVKIHISAAFVKKAS